jgi:hypothetical protein
MSLLSRHCEQPTGPAFGRPDDKLRDEAIQSLPCILDSFAEPVIGQRFAPTRWLAMTVLTRIGCCLFILNLAPGLAQGHRE